MEEKNNLDKIIIDDTEYVTSLTNKYLKRKKYVAQNPKELNAFIPGIICNIYVKTGQQVKEGDMLLILEAMKMKNSVTAHIDGTIKNIHVKTGDMVAKNQLLLEFE